MLLGSLSAGAISRAFTPQEIADHAWRLPFLAGGIFCLRSLYLRRRLHETPVFAELMAMRAVAHETPLKLVLRRSSTQCGAVVLADLDGGSRGAGSVVDDTDVAAAGL